MRKRGRTVADFCDFEAFAPQQRSQRKARCRLVVNDQNFSRHNFVFAELDACDQRHTEGMSKTANRLVGGQQSPELRGAGKQMYPVRSAGTTWNRGAATSRQFYIRARKGSREGS